MQREFKNIVPIVIVLGFVHGIQGADLSSSSSLDCSTSSSSSTISALQDQTMIERFKKEHAQIFKDPFSAMDLRFWMRVAARELDPTLDAAMQLKNSSNIGLHCFSCRVDSDTVCQNSYCQQQQTNYYMAFDKEAYTICKQYYIDGVPNVGKSGRGSKFNRILQYEQNSNCSLHNPVLSSSSTTTINPQNNLERSGSGCVDTNPNSNSSAPIDRTRSSLSLGTSNSSSTTQEQSHDNSLTLMSYTPDQRPMTTAERLGALVMGSRRPTRTEGVSLMALGAMVAKIATTFAK